MGLVLANRRLLFQTRFLYLLGFILRGEACGGGSQAVDMIIYGCQVYQRFVLTIR